MSTIHVNGTTIAGVSTSNALSIYNVFVDVVRVTRINTALGMEEIERVIVSNHPAHIKWKMGSEKIQFDKTTHYRDATLRCRATDVTTKDRIRYLDQMYEIVDVVDVRNLGQLLSMDIKRIE